MISLVQLGTVDYATGLKLQQQLVALRKEEKIGDVLLLLEHMPVITLGRNAKAQNVVASADFLQQRGVELFECDRGGDVTFHGPGQIVGYPIFDLRSFAAPDGKRKTLGVIEFVRRLEEVLMRTCADFAIPTKRVAGLTGVWTDPENTPVATAASAVPQSEASGAGPTCRSQTRRYRRPHLPLRHLAWFRPKREHRSQLFQSDIPCGIATKPVTSMQRELGEELDLNAVAESISRNFGVVFQSQILWVDTPRRAAGPQRRRAYAAAAESELRQIHKSQDEITNA